LLEAGQVTELKEMTALLPHLVQNFELAAKKKRETALLEAWCRGFWSFSNIETHRLGWI